MPSLPVGPRGAVGTVSPVIPSFVMRSQQAIRYAIAGITPATWFGPLQPLAPFADQSEEAGVKGRRYDYPTGRNLNYTPRADSPISFADLRSLSLNCDILRGVIEARKDQLAALDWAIRPTEGVNLDDGTLDNPDQPIFAGKLAGGPSGGPGGAGMGNASSAIRPAAIPRSQLNTLKLPADVRQRIRNVTDFFSFPDKENNWDQWMRQLNEDMFVLDAPTLWKRRTRGGDLYALELMDGATIFPLLDASGRRPSGPADPAYQQILHGIPAADYTASELIYLPRNRTTNRVYGLSPVEQIVVTVNTAIRRSIFQLEYYLSGSNPDAFVGLPTTWTLQNVKDFQSWFDGLMEGNLANRRKTRFMPGEFKYQETKAPPLKDSYDEWLARIVCFAFSVSPEPFIEHLNRATAGTARSRALEEGLLPLQRWWKFLMDLIIRFELKEPGLEFVFLDDREQDPKAQMEIDIGYVKAGVFSIDEVRRDRGRLPAGGVAEQPMLATTSGYVPLGALTGPGAAAALASTGSPGANAVAGTETGDDGGVTPNAFGKAATGGVESGTGGVSDVSGAAVASPKHPKSSVDYSPGGLAEHCGICHNYRSGECLLVEGEINPDYWCKLFLKAQPKT